MTMTTNTQNTQKKSVNTNGLQFYNNYNNSIIRSTIVLGFYDKYVNVKIHPALNPEVQTSSRQYDYTQFVSCLLSFENLVLLSNRLDALCEYINRGEDKSVGIPLGPKVDSLLSLVYKADADAILIYIYKNINPETKKADTIMGYQFNKSNSVDDYNAGTGTFTTMTFQNEFYAFKAFINTVISAMTNANAHCQRYADRYWRDRITPSNGTDNNTNSNNSSVSWNNNPNNNSQIGSVAETENLEYASDIEKFLS